MTSTQRKFNGQKWAKVGSLLRDIDEGSFLVCCGFEGNVWRIDAKTGDRTNLLSGLQFDDASVDYESERMWLSEVDTPRLMPYARGISPSYSRSIRGRRKNSCIHYLFLIPKTSNISN